MNEQAGGQSGAGGRSAIRSYGVLVGLSVLAGVGIAAVGYVPTVQVAGSDAVGSMLAGCTVSLAASCVGAIPIARVAGGDSGKVPQAILASTGLRFVAALLLIAPLLLSGWFDRVVFAVWVGVSYLLMLAVDTVIAGRIVQRIS